MWTYKAGGFPADAEAMVGYRDIPKEPMVCLPIHFDIREPC